jgi:hypothetical protein
MRERHFLDHPVPPHPAAEPAEPKGFRHRTRGARAYMCARVERQNEVGCVRQRLLEHRGEAVGGDDIKSDTRTDYDSRGLRIRVPALRGEKDVKFAGDVEIMSPAREASVDHLRAGGCERACAMSDHGHIRERCRSRPRVAKIEDPRGQTKRRRQRLDWAGAPAGQHRVQAPAPRLHGHKAPGIAVGTVDHPLNAIGHRHLTQVTGDLVSSDSVRM